MSRELTRAHDAINVEWAVPLLDAVARVQELVSRQAPPDEIYQATVDGVVGLLGADTGALRFIDPHDPEWMIAVAARATTGVGERWRQRSPITEGGSGRAITTKTMSILEGDEVVASRSRLAPAGTQATIALPIRDRGDVVGALVAATRTPGRCWSQRDKEVMHAYVSHVEAALAVARASHERIQVYTDPLTGLGNRALLLERAEQRIARARRHGRSAAVLFLDLDRFKLVNDSLGHIAGNMLLVEVAERLVDAVRSGDICVRLGADEFAVLLAAGSDAEAAAERIIEAIESRFEIDGHEVFIGVSVGIAEGLDSAQTLLRNADLAMDHAKCSGAGRTARFAPSMYAARLSRLGIDTELRHAIERGELELYFQPLHHLQSGALNAFESLVRWRHPKRGLVGPAEFIPVAEETGLIVEIDRWVLEEACRHFARWWRHTALAITVNVTVRDLQQPHFAEVVRDAIDGRFPPSALVLEITESAALPDAPQALSALQAVKELGVRVALDDFGTGYSSLLSLSQLPVDVLKVARPFVQGAAPGDEKARGLLAGMLSLGRHLNVLTVAEGIETEEQRDLLIELGCDIGQGYLLGRPADGQHATLLVEQAVARP
jgi:diguanylate cyclase (GGDEF)-like protein